MVQQFDAVNSQTGFNGTSSSGVSCEKMGLLCLKVTALVQNYTECSLGLYTPYN